MGESERIRRNTDDLSLVNFPESVGRFAEKDTEEEEEATVAPVCLPWGREGTGSGRGTVRKVEKNREGM